MSNAALPFWPRGLSAAEAARYVGVSETLFLHEVAEGKWPQPQRRGRKGGRRTWDRALLDTAMDRLSGIEHAIGVDPYSEALRR